MTSLLVFNSLMYVLFYTLALPVWNFCSQYFSNVASDLLFVFTVYVAEANYRNSKNCFLHNLKKTKTNNSRSSAAFSI